MIKDMLEERSVTDIFREKEDQHNGGTEFGKEMGIQLGSCDSKRVKISQSTIQKLGPKGSMKTIPVSTVLLEITHIALLHI